MSGKTWLITGGAGFIGSNLAVRLLTAGASVRVLDDLSTGRREAIAQLTGLGGRRFRFIEGSLLDQPLLATACDGVDVAVNLAAQVSVPKSIEDPETTRRINVEGFRCLLAAVSQAKVGRVLFASSSAVYGDNPSIPLAETAQPRPLNPYAESKVCNERDAADFAARHPETPALGFRFFNVYGSGQSADGGYAAVIPAWMAALTTRRPPIVHGDGLQTRDFCHVDDVSDALHRAGHGTAAPSGLYNVASGRPLALLDLLALMSMLHEHASGRKAPQPQFQPPRAGDIRHSASDISKSRAMLGFTPTVSLKDGLSRLLAAVEDDNAVAKRQAIGL